MRLLRRRFLRQGLLGTLGLVAWFSLSGCSRPPKGCNAVPANEIILGSEPGAFFMAVPSLATEFHQYNQSVQVVPWQSVAGLPIGTSRGRAPFVLSSVFGHAPPLLYGSLNSALRALNYDAGRLSIGVSAAFESAGQIFGIPMVAHPTVIGWRKDVFRYAGLRPPRVDWSQSDLMEACAALADVVRSKKVPGLEWVMPPMVAGPTIGTQTASAAPGWLRTHPAVWAGFVGGFGGTTWADGAFHLSNPGCLRGLQALTEFIRLFGVSDRPLTADDVDPVSTLNSTALQFVSYPYAPMATDSRWAFTRFPVLPHPVIPTQYEGIGLDYEHGGGSKRVDAESGDAIVAAASFLVWLLGKGPQRQLGDAGLPPVLADNETQTSFWRTAPGHPFTPTDWTQFADYMQDWPALPNGTTFDVTDIVYQAIQSSVADPSGLRDAVAAADARLAAWMSNRNRLAPVPVNTGQGITAPILSTPHIGPVGCG